MEDFIKQLKTEHRAILAVLQKVKTAGSHTMEGRNILADAQKLLIDHLEREDDKLYPGLRKISTSKPELNELLEQYEDEIKGITRFCISFFDKYLLEGGGIEFLRDFDKLYASLQERIKREEEVLFQIYQETSEQTGPG